MNTNIKAIGDFIFVEHIPEKADAIMVVGGSHPELGEKAAELWKDGYAPYIFIGGGVSIKSGVFPGPRSKADVYSKSYKTEYDFFTDVLLINGVPQGIILGENRSSYTRENALFAKQVAEENHIYLKKVLLVCKAFHARRCLMFYQAAFPGVEFLLTPISGYNISKDNWYLTEYGVKRVLGELKRCGDQFAFEDINNYINEY
ncbi:YdcF family protein [Anaerocolumna sp.]|uniref:YdcF family protein n=1 Tax=Anaerocolumna sp. TaxID=2041569 RepID=UPI0028AAEB55|nr:YdcF family protein [Anaerocolumna sp.]